MDSRQDLELLLSAVKERIYELEYDIYGNPDGTPPVGADDRPLREAEMHRQRAVADMLRDRLARLGG